MDIILMNGVCKWILVSRKVAKFDLESTTGRIAHQHGFKNMILTTF